MVNRGCPVSDNQAAGEEVASLPTADGNRTPIGRWVPMDAAAVEMGVSRSTLERRIQKEEVEAVKQGHNVFVLLHGPEPLSDLDLLEDARRELAESERTVSELRETESNLRKTIDRLNQSLKDSERWASIMTAERNQSRSDFRKEREEHRFQRGAAIVLSVITIASLLFVLIATRLSG